MKKQREERDMKKHNKLFYISITGLLLVVVGTCMIGAGISAGGSKTFLSVNESTASSVAIFCKCWIW